MSSNNPIVDAVADSLKPHGFRKNARSWYLESPETILIVNVQKSQFGNQFYLNCSVVFRSISTVARPKEYHGDIRFRLESVLSPSEAELCVKLLNLENELFSDEERQAKFAGLFARALPLLFRCRTEAGAAEALFCKALPDWMLNRAGAELLHRAATCSPT
ncbi:DUF4304 domain-containing protein [Ensifer adhaerens]|uniref:DUF4304 domain-containing protein n=1 Tax=Ensifer adhaerens TaxID=106592 RepID=UPI000DE49941|nr:DUF4304 domain-containing protein [Ensifer adhaerens]WDZ78011.1 DUF4304 domain-containing protein [Ensifer adhaerens]